MDLDPLILSRIQFAFVISFHILFPAFTIGLASWLAWLEGAWLLTKRPHYRDLYFFWVKVFAVSFGMGVVSGIVMSFQFGTNWSRFSELAGNVIGPLLHYEVLTAFFLEASFLGIMLFGWNRVGPKFHFFATLMVAIGTLISTFWIISANSWMHTPAGYELRDGVFYPVDWWAVVFNPSFPYRLVHMVLAAFLTTSFVVAAVSSWYVLRGRFPNKSLLMLKNAMAFIIIVAPLQIIAGDYHGLNVRDHQPAKLAAMEGLWTTHSGVPLVLFGWPDEEAEETRYEIAIPKLGSLILTHSWDGEVTGLDAFAPEDRPPVKPVFFAFRIMVALGVAMLLMAGWGLLRWWRGRLSTPGLFHRLCIPMGASGFVAILAGWFTAEIGRQPWVVYGVLRTADALSPVGGGSVLTSLITFMVVYLVIFGAGSWYLLRLLRTGPVDHEPPETDDGTPRRPLSVPERSAESPS